MTCLLTMCIGKWFTQQLKFFDDDEPDTSSLYNDIKENIAFKMKVIKKDRKLKAEIKKNDAKRQQRRRKLIKKNLHK